MAREERHVAAALAAAYGISASWVRTQRRRAERNQVPRPPGRPRLSDAERARVRRLVLEQFEEQGVVGWRRVLEGIRKKEACREKPTSTQLVQEETAAVKRERRSRKERALEAAREGHELFYRDAMWSQDAANVGRRTRRRKVEVEAATDRASTATVVAAVGPPATGEDLREHLERARVERGGLPLVWQSDGGGANRSKTIEDYLRAERVLHMISRPHTPTDNPVAEQKNRELEEETGLGNGVRLGSDAEAAARIALARRRLDHGRLRASRGWKTASELDAELLRADTIVHRDEFYEEARSAMKKAVHGLTKAAAIRRAEQDAIWRTLEKHGLARLHVGRRRTPCPRLARVAPIANG